MGNRAGNKVLFVYIAGEFIFSFAVAFLFFFFIFFVNQILLMAEQILSKHVNPLDVARLIIYAIPNIIAYSFPFSALVGSLMAVGRLVGDNEILAMQSAGLPLRFIAVPIFAVGIVLSGLAFLSNDVLLPLGTMKFNTLYREILYANPALELEPYSIKRYQDRTIATGAVEGNRIDNIAIFDRDEKKNHRTINAAYALLEKDTSDRGIISLGLHDVVALTSDQKRAGTYEYSTAESMEYNILLKDISLAVHSLTPREKSLSDLQAEIRQKEAQLAERRRAGRVQQERSLEEGRALYLELFLTGEGRERQLLSTAVNALLAERERILRDRSLQLHLLEYHKKIALPAACVIFLFFAFPAGSLSKRSGRSIGFGIGLFVSLLYWGLLFAGQTLGIRSDFSPFLSVWGANIIVLAAGLSLSLIRSRR